MKLLNKKSSLLNQEKTFSHQNNGANQTLSRLEETKPHFFSVGLRRAIFDPTRVGGVFPLFRLKVKWTRAGFPANGTLQTTPNPMTGQRSEKEVQASSRLRLQ